MLSDMCLTASLLVDSESYLFAIINKRREQCKTILAIVSLERRECSLSTVPVNPLIKANKWRQMIILVQWFVMSRRGVLLIAIALSRFSLSFVGWISDAKQNKKENWSKDNVYSPWSSIITPFFFCPLCAHQDTHRSPHVRVHFAIDLDIFQSY